MICKLFRVDDFGLGLLLESKQVNGVPGIFWCLSHNGRLQIRIFLCVMYLQETLMTSNKLRNQLDRLQL